MAKSVCEGLIVSLAGVHVQGCGEVASYLAAGIVVCVLVLAAYLFK